MARRSPDICSRSFSRSRPRTRCSPASARSRGLPTFRRQSSLRTWLYRLAWNAARDFQKEQERTPIRALRTTEISGIGAEIAASRPPFERSSFVDAFAKLRESLDPQEQTLLTLRLHAGMSWNEIAEVVGRKPAALRKRYERLKARCGSKLRPPAFSAGRAGLNALSRNMNSSRFPTRASLRFDRPACASWRSRLLRDAKRCHAQKMWTDARLTRSKRSKTTTPNNAKTCVKSGP